MQEHSTQGEYTLELDLNRKNSLLVSQMTLDSENHNACLCMAILGALFWQGRLKASCACHRCQSLMLACYLDSGETRIIKIRIAKKNTENLKNRNVLCTQKFLALRYAFAARIAY